MRRGVPPGAAPRPRCRPRRRPRRRSPVGATAAPTGAAASPIDLLRLPVQPPLLLLLLLAAPPSPVPQWCTPPGCHRHPRTLPLARAQLLAEDDVLREPWYTQIWKDDYSKGFPHASLYQKGFVTNADKTRLDRQRVYPHGNSTAEALMQYKKDVPNGNSYNMVGDSVGDLPSQLFIRNHHALSQARSNGAAAATHDYVLFGGGVLDNSNPGVAVQSDRVDIYHEPTRVWTTSALPGGARQDLSAMAAGGLILFAGGWRNDADEDITHSDAVDVWDTSTQDWVLPGLTLSEARSNMFVDETQGKIYFVGGNAGYYSQVYYSDRVDVFDSATRTFEPTLKLPQSRAYLAGGCAQGYCVFGGGYHLGHYTSFRNPTITNRIDALNCTTGEWKKMQLLEARASMGSTVVQDRFVVFAGGISDAGRTDMINIFDVELERFVHGYLSLARASAKCLSIGYIAVCGGGVADGGTVDKGVQWQKEGEAIRAQRLDVLSIFKRTTDIVTQYEYLQDALATAVQGQFAVASDHTFYMAGGINNRRRTIDRVEMFQRRHDSLWSDGVQSEPQHAGYEWPQWRPMWINETCRRIWCDWKTSGPPMHAHRCGTAPDALTGQSAKGPVAPPEKSYSTVEPGQAHWCDGWDTE